MLVNRRYGATKYALQITQSFTDDETSEDEANQSDSSADMGNIMPYRGIHRKCRSAKPAMSRTKWSKDRSLDDSTVPDFHVTLHQASRDGDVEMLKMFLDHLSLDAARLKVNQKDENKLSPLHYAARYNHKDIVELLLSKGADVNVEGDGGLTPLHFAARYGYNEILKPGSNEEPNLLAGSCKTVICSLVTNGAHVNCKDNFKMTPLHYAAVRGNAAAAELLLKCPQMNTEEYDKQEMTPLHCAAYYNHTEVVELLLLADAEPRVEDENMSTPLHLACSTGNEKIVSLLLEAVRKRYGLKILLEYIERKNNSMCTALHLAVNKSDLDIVKRLIEAGADVKAKKEDDAQPIHIAAACGNVAIMTCLVDSGAQVNSSNAFRETPLHKAAAFNCIDVIRFLIENNANIECRDNGHFTPLIVAAAEGHKEAIEILLEFGADIQTVCRMDQSTVFWACQENHPEALKVLLSNVKGAELVDRCDRYDNSPLHIAALKGYEEIVQILIDHNVTLCKKNEHEQTAIHLAAMNGHVR